MSSTTLILALLIFSFNDSFAETRSAALIKPRWKVLNDDIEVSTIKLSDNQPLSSELMIVRTRLKNYSIDVLIANDFGLKGSDAGTFCDLSHAHVCINANFFDENGDPLGLVVKNGLKKRKIHKGGKLLDGIFQIVNGYPQIISREMYIDDIASYAVQAGPLLIERGKTRDKIKDTTSESKRSGICIDSKKRLLLFSSTPGLGGISIGTLQNILLEPSIGCIDALNFDGGGSAQMVISAPSKIEGSPLKDEDKDDPVILNFNGRDNVPVVLALMPNQKRVK